MLNVGTMFIVSVDEHIHYQYLTKDNTLSYNIADAQIFEWREDAEKAGRAAFPNTRFGIQSFAYSNIRYYEV